MRSSFRQGVFAGFLGALAFLGGVLYWIYRATGRVPFPVSRPAPGELLIKLVPPEEVPSYWQRWRTELAPMVERWRALIAEIKTLKGA